jgi:predicted esterase
MLKWIIYLAVVCSVFAADAFSTKAERGDAERDVQTGDDLLEGILTTSVVARSDGTDETKTLENVQTASNQKLGGDQNLLSTGASAGLGNSILTAGAKVLGNRSFEVLVPAGAGPFPVLILVHGRKGNGKAFLRTWSRAMPTIQNSMILVAPTGMESTDGTSWNIVREPSKEDDVLFVGSTLLAHLESFSNVEPEFKLLGYSNGAALTNRILIENDDPRITAAVTMVCQLPAVLYHDSTFYIGTTIPGGDNEYVTPKDTLTKRRLLLIVGGLDTTVPPDALNATLAQLVLNKVPNSRWPRARIPGLGNMLQWEESAFAYAKAYGYQGAKASVVEGTGPTTTLDNYASVEYPVSVSAYNILAREHGGAGGITGSPLAADKALQFLTAVLSEVPTAETTAPTAAPSAEPTSPPTAQPIAPPPAPTFGCRRRWCAQASTISNCQNARWISRRAGRQEQCDGCLTC